MTMPNITAAICTYNRYDTLPKAIVSLTHQSLPVDQFVWSPHVEVVALFKR